MDPISIVAAINAAAQLAKALAPIAGEAIRVANSNDADEIKAALAGLQAANDQLHDRVQAKLRG